jgi:quinol monooxygenase YgiN
MVISTSRMIVRSERRGDLLRTIKGILEPTRVERGCLSYRLYTDVENRNAFVLLEEWATQEDFERHILTENEQRLLTLLDLLSVEPELRFNTVSKTAGMELIDDVLKADKIGR